MGFSQVAVFAFIITAGVAVSHLAVGSTLNANQKIDEAKQDEDRRVRLERVMDCTALVPVFNPVFSTVTVSATNDAPLTFDAQYVDVLFEGNYESDHITARRVDGTISDVWAPDTTLALTVGSQTSLPDAVSVVTEVGICDYWRT